MGGREKVLFFLSTFTLLLLEIRDAGAADQVPDDTLSQLALQAGAIIKDSKNVSEELSSLVKSTQLNKLTGNHPQCRQPCRNGGKCIRTDTCACINDWFGADCTQFVCSDRCIHGSCTAPDTCFCALGWKGKSCDTPICNPECLNAGFCEQPNVCRCPDGYTGAVCEIAVCDPPCVNGICTRRNECQCLAGWSDLYCDVPVCELGCQHNGRCVRPDTCECSGPWHGHSCDLPVCSKRCQNGGRCVAPDECDCTPGYKGPQCQYTVQTTKDAGTVCSMWGGRHIRTFDGHSYDFPGQCRYMWVQDCVQHLFSIELVKNIEDFIPIERETGEITNRTLFNELPVPLRELVHFSDDFLALVLKLHGGEPVSLLPGRLVMVGDRLLSSHRYAERGIAVYQVGQYVRVETRFGITIMWSGGGVAEIEMKKGYYRGTVCGLCGNADGDSSNDMTLPDKTTASNALWFARGWKETGLHDHCSEISQVIADCSSTSAGDVDIIRALCKIFISNNEAFSDCIAAGVDPVPLVDGCITDVCQCNKVGRQDCHCDAVAQYSRLCMSQTEVVPRWRKPNFCAVTCPEGMVYSECASSCPRTCHNLVTPDTECHEHCVDGCTCPEGSLLHDGKCVREDECSCLHNGREFPAGHVLSQECQSCVCSSAVWNCTDIPCPSECSAVGDPHYKTFDGHMYTMHGECQYTFVKDCSSTNLFSVIVDNTVCGVDSTVTCTKDVTIVLRSGFNKVLIRLSKGHVTSVDGKAVMPPYIRERFQIFKVSSDFVQLRTDIGIMVDWDGISRVYVTAERRWQGKLCGLCGNYNRNQRDDFMNFNGLVERSPVSFGNAWKASPDCIDMTSQFIQDPCQVNQQRVGFANTECQVILSETFQACHVDVSPQPYYDLCRYDVCECEEPESCLCNTIAHYARVCSRAGHVTDWRMENFCHRECPGGQVYRECSSTCHSTCRSLSDQSVRCGESCVQGCNCPDGLYLNQEGTCVKQQQCECYHNGRTYRAFEVIHREFSTCHCMEGRLTCVDISNEGNEESLTNRTYRVAFCPFGQIHKSCNISEGNPTGIECQKTCKNFGEDCFAQTCVVGCACPSGQVFDSERSVCIQASDCPCYYGGQAYLPGHSVTIDCNRCECRNREWECTQDECVGTCTAYGDPHYETFDGFTYNYMGTCNYILTQNYCDQQRGTFRVYVENTLCGSDGMACTKAVSIILEDKITIRLERENFGYKAENMVSWGPSPGSDTNHTNIVWDYHHVGLYTMVTTDIGLMVVWDRKTTVIVKLDPRYMSAVCGLCGNFDGNQNNDAMKSDRMLAVTPLEFGNSWKTSPNCDNTPPSDDPCTLHPNRKPWAQRSCNILQSEIFQPCHALVDVTWYYSNCKFDACGCDGGADCECFCVAVAAYARACAEAGRPIRWRTPNVCPLMCEAYNTDNHDCTWHYSECQTACPITCQHRYLSTAIDQCSLSMACVEGCFPHCPEGTLYDESSQRCVSQCQKGCHSNGRFYLIGDVVTEDNCHICTCSLLESIECTTASKCQPPPKEHVLALPSVQRYCDGAVNLVFLVQSTHHISAHEFQDVKKLIETYVSSVAPKNYGKPNSTLRVAIQQYGDRLEHNLALQDHQNMSILLNTIHDLQLQRGSENPFTEALRSGIAQFNLTEKPVNSTIENVLFAITFSTPQEDINEVLEEMENLKIKAIILRITHHGHGRFPDERTMTSYAIEELSDIFSLEYSNMAMEILNEICEGRNEVLPNVTTPSPVTPVVPRVELPPFEPLNETCTMQADLVVLIDTNLLVDKDKGRSRRKRSATLQYVSDILDNVTISPDHTHVSVLLADKQVRRVSKFQSSRDEVNRAIEETISKIILTDEVASDESLDLAYALLETLVGYLENEHSHARLSPANHKSILLLQENNILGQKEAINESLSELHEHGVILTAVTQPDQYRNYTEKNALTNLLGKKNLIFANITGGGAPPSESVIEKTCRTPETLETELLRCQQDMDVYFILDTTEIQGKDWENMVNGVKKISKALQPINFPFNTNNVSGIRTSLIGFNDRSAKILVSLYDGNGLLVFLRSDLPVRLDNFEPQSNLSFMIDTISTQASVLSADRGQSIVIIGSSLNKDKRNHILKDKASFANVIHVSVGQQTIETEEQDDAFEQIYLRSTRELLDNTFSLYVTDHVCASVSPVTTTITMPLVPKTTIGTLIPGATTIPSVFGVTTTTTIPSVPGATTTTIPSVPGETTTTIPSVPGETTTTVPSVPGVTTTTIPSVPGVTTTTIPSVPGVTTITIPSVPGETTTTIPSVPGVTTTTVPSVPGVTTTTIPSATGVTTTTTIPSVPGVTTTPSVPGETTTTIPSIPGAITIPSVPGVTTTTIPSVSGVTTTTIPSVPGVTTTIPSLPGVTTTTSPSVSGATTTTIPSVPGVTTTTIPSIPGATTITSVPGVTSNNNSLCSWCNNNNNILLFLV
uniref:mucin-2-like n=1 Tax=Ciona intestinalis TaxID=7719 RepID=UPI000EF44CC9|nr:mucin-2-like [Ciona intestinalis]|eukprot:XP_026689876.1 mucin-2-like [Ciona intestinalis]